MFGDSPAIMNMGALRILIIPLPLRDGRTLDLNILIITVPHTRTPFFTLGLRVVVAEPDEFPVSMHQPSSSHVHLVVAMRTLGDDGAAVRPQMSFLVLNENALSDL